MRAPRRLRPAAPALIERNGTATRHRPIQLRRIQPAARPPMNEKEGRSLHQIASFHAIEAVPLPNRDQPALHRLLISCTCYPGQLIRGWSTRANSGSSCPLYLQWIRVPTFPNRKRLMQKGVQPRLNSVAAGIVDEQRGHHSTHVSAYDGKPLTRIGNSTWYVAVAQSAVRPFCPTFR